MSAPLVLGAVAALAVASELSKRKGSQALSLEQILAMAEQAKRSAPAVVETRLDRSCGVPMDGNAERGRGIIDFYVREAVTWDPPRGYNPIKDYDKSAWQGLPEEKGIVNTVRGQHLAALRSWQPALDWFDLIVLNTSAGKDSLAMMVLVDAVAKAAGVHHKLVAIHADLGRVEHPEVAELARSQAEALGIPFHIVHRKDAATGVRKDLLERFVEQMQFKVYARPSHRIDRDELIRRGYTFNKSGAGKNVGYQFFDSREEADEAVAELKRWFNYQPWTGAVQSPPAAHYSVRESRGFPGFGTRYCTSEFKTAEVAGWTTQWAKAARQSGEVKGRPARILQTLGLRAQESGDRAKKGFGVHKKFSRNQENYRWLPIQMLSTQEVWDVIAASGISHHPAYDVGFRRLSCRLCPLAGDEDLALAALTYPQHADEVRAIERKYDRKLKESRSLDDSIRAARQRNPGIDAKAKEARSVLGELMERERERGSRAMAVSGGVCPGCGMSHGAGSRALSLEQILAMAEQAKRAAPAHPGQLAARRQREERNRLVDLLTEAASRELSTRSNPRRRGGQQRFQAVPVNQIKERLQRLSTEELQDLELALQQHRKPRGR
jgi:3'-phosphoadenosine 5'-phosphosulfate sulfotransferase (PAPS reductase)/FAD synthetase